MLLTALAMLGVSFKNSIHHLLFIWETKEEYGYAYLIPALTLFFVWQKKEELARIDLRFSYAGIGLLILAGFLGFIGNMSTTITISEYGLVLAILGVVLAMMGWRAFKLIAVPLMLLFFMVPLPGFLFSSLSTKLQLVSSEIGTEIIRLFGISVYLEGNVIDLGVYKLQVAEACSGLRYLFPLMSLSFIVAYMYKASFWKRAVLFISSMPITVLMNSFRIGMIGILVEYYGIEQAEGFLHDFEGWVIFMACTGVLILEMWILSHIGKDKRPLSESFYIELPGSSGETAGPAVSRFDLRDVTVLLVTGAIFASSVYTQQVEQPKLSREVFAQFPLKLGEWKGRSGKLDQIYLDSLKLDDYLLADYLNQEKEAVNLYIAYYDEQQAGEAVHSPRACIPGGGWKIQTLDEVELENVHYHGRPLKVNRLLIQQGDYSQLVYYWFNQRGRNMANEYLVKWYLFWDAFNEHRTDGALIRLTTFLPPGQDIEMADKRLTGFAAELVKHIDDYIPD